MPSKRTAMTYPARPSCIHRSLRWLRRLRNRQGYNVHSPFAFNLITEVIYNDGFFNKYARLYRDTSGSPWLEKDLRLIFRLANHLQVKQAHFKGNAQLLQPLRIATMLACETAGCDGAPPFDFLVLTDIPSPKDWELLIGTLQAEAFVVIADICSSSARRKAWKHLLKEESIRQSFDLAYFGFLVLDPRFFKENYIINYI